MIFPSSLRREQAQKGRGRSEMRIFSSFVVITSENQIPRWCLLNPRNFRLKERKMVGFWFGNSHATPKSNLSFTSFWLNSLDVADIGIVHTKDVVKLIKVWFVQLSTDTWDGNVVFATGWDCSVGVWDGKMGERLVKWCSGLQSLLEASDWFLVYRLRAIPSANSTKRDVAVFFQLVLRPALLYLCWTCTSSSLFLPLTLDPVDHRRGRKKFQLNQSFQTGLWDLQLWCSWGTKRTPEEIGSNFQGTPSAQRACLLSSFLKKRVELNWIESIFKVKLGPLGVEVGEWKEG